MHDQISVTVAHTSQPPCIINQYSVYEVVHMVSGHSIADASADGLSETHMARQSRHEVIADCVGTSGTKFAQQHSR